MGTEMTVCNGNGDDGGEMGTEITVCNRENVSFQTNTVTCGQIWSCEGDMCHQDDHVKTICVIKTVM